MMLCQWYKLYHVVSLVKFICCCVSGTSCTMLCLWYKLYHVMSLVQVVPSCVSGVMSDAGPPVAQPHCLVLETSPILHTSRSPTKAKYGCHELTSFSREPQES